ncbi:hypothetical protein EDB19DRAFT_629566 [Suillus lakei]|nr:hypothetical protein EDB19DRAFT_629566 [Suillus lakei]
MRGTLPLASKDEFIMVLPVVSKIMPFWQHICSDMVCDVLLCFLPSILLFFYSSILLFFHSAFKQHIALESGTGTCSARITK